MPTWSIDLVVRRRSLFFRATSFGVCSVRRLSHWFAVGLGSILAFTVASEKKTGRRRIQQDIVLVNGALL